MISCSCFALMHFRLLCAVVLFVVASLLPLEREREREGRSETGIEND